MFSFLLSLSDLQLFCTLSFVFILISMVAVFLVRAWIPLELRYKDNPVIGNISSLIGIIYGVLAGLTALYLINNITYVTDAIEHEANAVADFYRESKWLSEPLRTQVHHEIKDYLNQVITVEWPAMADDAPMNKRAVLIINQISDQLYHYHAVTNTDLLILDNLLDGIKTWYGARQQRIHMSISTLNTEVWVVILIGTILAIGINYLFGMNFYLHLLTVSAAALMAASMVFLLLTLDRPFQGDFIVEPDAFREVLSMMENKT